MKKIQFLKGKLPIIIFVALLVFLFLITFWFWFLPASKFEGKLYFIQEGETFVRMPKTGEIKPAKPPFKLVIEPDWRLVKAGESTTFQVIIENTGKLPSRKREFVVQTLLSSPTPDNPKIDISLLPSRVTLDKNESRAIELRIQTAEDTPTVFEFEEGYTIQVNVITSDVVYRSDKVKLYVE